MSHPSGGLAGLNRGQKSTFLEYGHAAYQIKGNEVYNNIQANILLSYPQPLGRMQKVKILNFYF